MTDELAPIEHKVVVEQEINTITVEETDVSIEVIEETINLIAVGMVGPRGARGERGPEGSVGGHSYEQRQPASIWSIQHNLGRKPSVTIVIDDSIVYASINYETDDLLTIRFLVPKSGSAYLV